MNKPTTILLLAATAAILSGCAPERPADASDPKASATWVKYALKQAGKTQNAALRLRLLRTAVDDAAALGDRTAFADQLQAAPGQVYALAIQTGDIDAFAWALEQGVELDSGFHELVAYWNQGQQWRDFILARHPAALPVFMNQAMEDYNVAFFAQQAEAFKATGYKVNSPLVASEFNIGYCRFVAEQIEDALADGDTQRIDFLIDHMRPLPVVVYIDRKTAEVMRALGDFAFCKDEALACKLLALEYEYNRIDLAATGFGEAFKDALRAKPDYAVRALGLDGWQAPLSATEATFLLTLSDTTLGMLHKLHVDKAIELCMADGNTEGALRFIALRAQRAPLSPGDYTELMNWSLRYGNQTVFAYVLEHCDKLDLFRIDFAQLANNQTLFEQYAPKIMVNIYPSMDTAPRSDGTTLGRIKEVFANKNESAGLFLVGRYNLSNIWVDATEGRTLLMDVCHAGNLKAARYLIEQRGENLFAETGYSELEISLFGKNRPTEGKLSPIFFAAKGGNAALIKYLVSKGANVNARSNFGTTPLMHAVTAGHYDATRMLLLLKANVNAQMDANINQIDLRDIGSFDEVSTAYRRAKASGNDALLQLLVDAGAKP